MVCRVSLFIRLMGVGWNREIRVQIFLIGEDNIFLQYFSHEVFMIYYGNDLVFFVLKAFNRKSQTLHSHKT